jgi:hypothetical protein
MSNMSNVLSAASLHSCKHKVKDAHTYKPCARFTAH